VARRYQMGDRQVKVSKMSRLTVNYQMLESYVAQSTGDDMTGFGSVVFAFAMFLSHLYQRCELTKAQPNGSISQ